MASFAAAAAVSLALAMALGVTRRPPQERTAGELLLVTAISDAALLLVLFILGRRLLGLRAADLGFRAPTLRELGFAANVAGALWILSIVVNLAQIALFGPRPQSLIVTVGAHTGAVAFAMDLLTGAVIAPFAEEVLYRGLLFAGLAQRLPFWPAAAVSALLFALSHGLGVLAPIFALGIGLAYVYRRTGTLWAPILAHALVNAVSLALVFLLPRAA